MKRSVAYKAVGSLFIFLLLLPNIGLFRESRNRQLIGEIENRVINPKPTARLFSGSFFKQFEGWYDDRLLGRKDMIRFWAVLNGQLFKVLISKEIAQGKNGYLFMPFNLTKEGVDLEKKFEVLGKIGKECDDRKIPFFVFLPPAGEWFLPELLPDKYKPVDIAKFENETNSKLAKRGIQYVSINREIAKLSLRERDKLFIRGDYHWNRRGAYLGAQALLEKMNCAKNINLPMSYKSEETIGEVYTRKAGLNPIYETVEVPWNDSFINDFTEKFRENKKLIDVSLGDKTNHHKKTEHIFINEQADKKIKVLIFGDSFIGNMRPYLLQDVYEIVLVHNAEVSYPKTHIDVQYLLDTYKPDFVIYEKVGAFFYGYQFSEVFGKYKL